MTAPMLPGDYLAKRRTMSGYSLPSLARDLMLLTDFGGRPRLGDFNRLKLRLDMAESGHTHLSDDTITLIGNFVALDISVYRQLVDLAEAERKGQTLRHAHLPRPQVCRTCACSFFDPCDERDLASLGGRLAAPGETACHWAEDDLCSRCDRIEPSSPGSASPPDAEPPFIRLMPIGSR